MRKTYFSFFILIFILDYLYAQPHSQAAFLTEEGIIEVTAIRNPENVLTRKTYAQVPGFPVIRKAHQTFKNFRNVTLSDIDNDGNQDILVCMDETLYAFNGRAEQLWSVQLDGTSNFPPAVGDINGDGLPEIAVQTYGNPSVGNAYLFDHNGNIQDGWPLNFDNHLLLNAVTFADLNNDGLAEIILNEKASPSTGRVHAVNFDGSPFSNSWPVQIPGTPAFTASVGDIDANGVIDLITATTSAIYAFDASGQLLDGFPVSEPGSKISYQSPLLKDLDKDGTLEIIGARHGELSSFYILNHDGSYFDEWPKLVDHTTYSTPSVCDINEDGFEEVFFGKRYNSDTSPAPILFGFEPGGNDVENFPKSGLEGLEGIITIADIDNDGAMEVMTTSNVIHEGKGSIRIFELDDDGSSVTLLETEGYTYLNGGYLGDVDGDGSLDLTVLSYQIKFDASSPDSAFINVFDLEVPYDPTKILFNGYKGSNDHSGYSPGLPSFTQEIQIKALTISPNPVDRILKLPEFEQSGIQAIKIVNSSGQIVFSSNSYTPFINTENFVPGIYWLKIDKAESSYIGKFIKL